MSYSTRISSNDNNGLLSIRAASLRLQVYESVQIFNLEELSALKIALPKSNLMKESEIPNKCIQTIKNTL